MKKNIPVLSLLPDNPSEFREARKNAYRRTQGYRPSFDRVLDATFWLRKTSMQDDDLYRVYTDAMNNSSDEALVNFITWALEKNYLPQPSSDDE